MFCGDIFPVYVTNNQKKQTKKIFTWKKNTKHATTKHKSKQSVWICIITANKIAVIKLAIAASGTVVGHGVTESPNHSTHVSRLTSKTMTCIYVSEKFFCVFCLSISKRS